MQTALISAYDKTDLPDFAEKLVERGWSLLASAGTCAHLKEFRIPAEDVALTVGDPILDHRVVTLSRELHAGLLARPEDQPELDRLNIRRIDLVYVNFYPLAEEIAKTGSTLQSVIEKTDIGGPALLRSAAKGRRITVSSRKQFRPVLNYIEMGRTLSKTSEDRFISGLVAAAESAVAEYCAASAAYHRKL